MYYNTKQPGSPGIISAETMFLRNEVKIDNYLNRYVNKYFKRLNVIHIIILQKLSTLSNATFIKIV